PGFWNLGKKGNQREYVCVRDPRLRKDDRWHTHVDYEICLHTNSMCFRKKTSYVRRSYSDFVWLRHCLEGNRIAQVNEGPGGVSRKVSSFIKVLVFQNPLLLSDSRLHLFLQSDLSIRRIERCALGKTRYTVAEAIQLSRSGYNSSEDKSSSLGTLFKLEEPIAHYRRQQLPPPTNHWTGHEDVPHPPYLPTLNLARPVSVLLSSGSHHLPVRPGHNEAVNDFTRQPLSCFSQRKHCCVRTRNTDSCESTRAKAVHE
uniref:PX domain-containing protein n=1 Tax=Poecilia mexicana TaxID=48701 RepID=A0A3B3X248_9TELE